MIRSLRPSAAKHRIAASLWALGWLIVISALPVLAQHSGPPGSSAPPLPSGAGRLTVQVIGEIAGGESGGLAIALYALSPDGTPGFANGETDIRGAHTFEGISTDPQIVYLVGVRYDEIPFGERVTFAPGEAEARVEIEISEPTDQLTGVEVEELRVRVDWMGDRLVVREILRINQSGERVIRLPAKDPDHAIAVRPLEPEARDFAAGASSIGEGLGLVAGGVRFWGPLYPGEQGVEYQYTWPVDGLEARLPIVLREAAKRVVVVAGTPGIEVSGPGLIASSEVSSDAGTPLSAWARSGLRGGERFEVTLKLPEIRPREERVVGG
jgi:hypothetical protein